MSFSDLKMMLQSRRDFTVMRDLNTSSVHNSQVPGVDDFRIVFMLSDDFDRFKTVDQEVVYDSANDDLAKKMTIKEEISRTSNDRFIRNCYKEQFLELICMLIKDDSVASVKI